MNDKEMYERYDNALNASMDVMEITSYAARKGITVNESDIDFSDSGEASIDEMDPYDWINAMTMD